MPENRKHSSNCSISQHPTLTLTNKTPRKGHLVLRPLDQYQPSILSLILFATSLNLGIKQKKTSTPEMVQAGQNARYPMAKA